MINNVTFRAIAREHGSEGSVSINAQVFVNKQRVVIPLSIYIPKNLFDVKAQRVKHNCPQSVEYNSIIANAIDRTAKILAEANHNNVRLERETFRARFTNTLSDIDFVSFWRAELEQRRGTIEYSTWKQQKSSFKKFLGFKTSVPFAAMGPDLIEDYERYLKKKGNNINTVACALKNLKTYLNLAIKKGIEIKNPFRFHKIRVGEGRRVFLTMEEVHSLLDIYGAQSLPLHLQDSLLIFLVQSFTSLRISDMYQMTENWINLGELEFIPFKTKKYQRTIRFGLSKVAERLLREFLSMKKKKKLKAEQTINDDLKIIAAHSGIRKSLTTHVARHTFATTFLTLGGDVVVLKEIMGHRRIETTMWYVNVVDSRKTQQMGNFDNEFK